MGARNAFHVEEEFGAVRCSSSTIPVPETMESPTVYADRVGEWYVAGKSEARRRKFGLYLTPVTVARFMALQIKTGRENPRILDPAAGSGILCCAAVEALLGHQSSPLQVSLDVYEVDPNLREPLHAVLDYLSSWSRHLHDVQVTFKLRVGDFILLHSNILENNRFIDARPIWEPSHDAVISNPPYFKVNKSDPRAVAVSSVVHGQPNIYSLFMAVGVALLRDNGDLIFITPRSFCSGPYFKKFREYLFDKVQPAAVHVFESRRDTFGRDAVLQENIIFTGTRSDQWNSHQLNGQMVVSTSRGSSDIFRLTSREIAIDSALDSRSINKVLRLPLTDRDDQVLALVDSWPNTLESLGLRISTGPVIPFRATNLIARIGKTPQSHVPLLWMNHVRPMQARWPINRYKAEYISRKAGRKLLVPNRNYVLLRRFSAKEESRRLTAAPYIASNFQIPEVGLENHLNYIYRPCDSLTEDEAWGLAALYNSQILDIYFRTINGNTQVSATELRLMPLPEVEDIVALGRRIQNVSDPLMELDALAQRLVYSNYMEVSYHGDS